MVFQDGPLGVLEIDGELRGSTDRLPGTDAIEVVQHPGRQLVRYHGPRSQ